MTEKLKRPWPMEEPAKALAARLGVEEVLALDNRTAVLVLKQDGVEYVLTMTRPPIQKRVQ